MKFDFPLHQGRLLGRYKRFMADIETADGQLLRIHCPNTGSMKNCRDLNSNVWYWDSGNSKRKYPHTWELVEVEQQYVACVNTGRANGLVKEAIDTGVIKELQGYEEIRPEVRYGDENSRIDWLLSYPSKEGVQELDHQHCYVEVKNVTLLRENGEGAFPDAVSTRGSKHLRELILMKQQGHRAVLLFCVAHTGISSVAPADDIDPTYGETLREAMKQGVEVYAYRTKIDLVAGEITVTTRVPVVLG